MDRFLPRLTVHRDGSELTAITLGHRLLDDYLVFVAVRARSNTWLAVAWDLKVFFSVVGKPPGEVAAADVFAFLAAQRAPRRGERVVRLDDGEAGLAARTTATSLGTRSETASSSIRTNTRAFSPLTAKADPLRDPSHRRVT